jgi:diaminopimelate decarboxylase
MPSLTDRLPLFPETTEIQGGSLSIGGHELAALAQEYGTPLYVYDRATMDACSARYKAALRIHYAGESSVTYAAKAFLCTAVAQWVRQQRLWLDVTSEAEMAMALAGGVETASIVVHGTNKSHADLQAAAQHAGTLVVDNLSELRRIVELGRDRSEKGGDRTSLPNVWLRLRPGVIVSTHHAHTQTGQSGSQFGMTADELVRAAQAARAAGLRLDGMHFHLGSNFRDPAPLTTAIDIALDLAARLSFGETWHFSPGGGWGVAYAEGELPQPDIEEYVKVVARSILKKCRAHHLSFPILHLEPGRSLIARAGVAVYRVGVIKEGRERTWLMTDGGMADNPRRALYGASYSCLPAAGLERPIGKPVWIAGPHCESGDVLIEDVRLPKMEEGEYLAVPASGAYQLSMSSNYNGARRPAVLWLDRGSVRLILRRETVDDLLHRDLSIH